MNILKEQYTERYVRENWERDGDKVTLIVEPQPLIEILTFQAARPRIEVGGHFLAIQDEKKEGVYRIVWAKMSEILKMSAGYVGPDRGGEYALLAAECEMETRHLTGGQFGYTPNGQIHSHPNSSPFWSGTDIHEGQVQPINNLANIAEAGELFVVCFTEMKAWLARRITWDGFGFENGGVTAYNDNIEIMVQTSRGLHNLTKKKRPRYRYSLEPTVAVGDIASFKVPSGTLVMGEVVSTKKDEQGRVLVKDITGANWNVPPKMLIKTEQYWLGDWVEMTNGGQGELIEARWKAKYSDLIYTVKYDTGLVDSHVSPREIAGKVVDLDLEEEEPEWDWWGWKH